MLIASIYTVFIKIKLNCTNKVKIGFKKGKDKKKKYLLTYRFVQKRLHLFDKKKNT